MVEFPPERLSDQCVFCDSPVVKRDDVRREPVDRVAPFVVDRQVASHELRQHLQDAWLAPNELRRCTAPEALAPMLIPFWVYDADCASDYQGRVGIWWYKTVTYTTYQNGKLVTRTRQERHTDWHHAAGSHVASYVDHLVSGSVGLPEVESNELEPFDLGQALPWDPTLVAGVMAERPTIDHKEAREVANQELANRENAAIRRFLPGDEVDSVQNTTKVEVHDIRLVLLPVWIATYHHKDEVFRLLVNGQTQEVVGNVPRSTLKIIFLVLAGIAAVFGLFLCAGAFATVLGIAL